MPTHAALDRNVKRFRREYMPLGLPERFEQLGAKLGIDRVRMLQLLGFTREEGETMRSQLWSEIIPQVEEQARDVEDLFRRLLWLYGYDWRSLSEDLHRSAGRGPAPDDRAETSRVTRSGATREPLAYLGDEILLTLIARGGPETLRHLLDFLTRDELRSYGSGS